MIALRLIAASMRLQLKLTLASPLAIVGWITTPSVLLVLTVLSHRRPLNGAESAHVMSAVLLAGFWASCVWSSVGVLRRDRQNGSLAATVSPVGGAQWVVLGKIMGACSVSLIGVCASVTVVGLLLGLRPAFASVGGLVAGLVATVLSGIAASCLIGGLLLVTRHGDHISNAIGVPVTLLGGTVIPPDALPAFIRPITAAISLSWIQKWLSGASIGELDWTSLTVALTLTALYGAAAILVLRRALVRARREGTLELA